MYAKCGEIECSRSVFDENLDRNVFSWSSMIAGYVQNNLAQDGWFHGYLIKCGFELGSYLVTAILDLYAKCGVVRDARSVFDELHDIDIVSWTAMIVGYTQNGCPEEALKLFLQKEQVGVLPNDVTIASVFSACSQLLNLNLALSSGHGILLSQTLWWINGSAYEALELFHQMRMGSVLPDAVTLVSVLSACASLNALQVGSSFHAYAVKRGLLSSNVYVGTGNGRGSLSIFGDMLKAELKPNEEIFTSILSACSHTGMIGEGWRLFTMICQDYNLVPSAKHYTCMVDLLARAGRLKEAWTSFRKCQFNQMLACLVHFSTVVDSIQGLILESWQSREC
ncbi:hypothetical protein NC651_024963 [Populus alba x Populus x berolinensis]|nr:hypothetical protein NC651_024963 [Populus alba x Populus x berolinensis]